MPNADAETGAARGTARAALLALAPLLAAALLTRVAAGLDGVPFESVRLLPPEPLGPGRLAVALAALLAGYFGVYVAPGLLLLRALGLRLPNAPAAFLAAFVLSLLGVSAAWMAAQAVTPGPAGRVCLYLTVAVLDVAALIAAAAFSPGAPALPRAGDPGRGRAELLVPLVGIGLVLAAAWVANPGKISVEALEGDATEVHGFAASLAHGALPEWDLESGAWGFYPTFLFVAYPVFFSLALLGDTEAALRLPALVFLGVMMLAAADLAGRGRSRSAGGTLAVLLPVLGVGWLSFQTGAFYAGYHPWHGDLGCSPLEEWVVTGLAMAGWVLLRDGAPRLAAIAALLSILTFPSGLMLVGLVGLGALATGSAGERRTAIACGGALAALLAAWALVLVAWTTANGTFDAMLGEWWEKYFRGRASFGAESPGRILQAAGWFALLAGGLPVLGLVAAPFRGDRTARWLALVAAIWVGFFLLSPNKNVHYFFPAALLPVAVALRTLVAGEGRAARSLGVAAALVLSAAVCIGLSRPRPVPPYVADREFGRLTLFLASSEREAVEDSRVLFNVMDPLWRWRPGRPWTIGHHTWVLYADRGVPPRDDHVFFVGRADEPPVGDAREITRISAPDGRTVRFWARGGRAALREWKELDPPRRTSLSPFHFDMPPAPR